jgi:hypothetical protein
LIGGHVHDGCQQVEDFPKRVDRSFSRRNADAADRGRSARCARNRKSRIAEPDLDLVDPEAKSFGRYHRDHGAGSGSEILSAQVDLDTSIGMDSRATLAVVAGTAPGVDTDSQSAFDGSGGFIAARVPVLLPLDHLRALGKLCAVGFGADG